MHEAEMLMGPLLQIGVPQLQQHLGPWEPESILQNFGYKQRRKNFPREPKGSYIYTVICSIFRACIYGSTSGSDSFRYSSVDICKLSITF